MDFIDREVIEKKYYICNMYEGGGGSQVDGGAVCKGDHL